MSIAKRVAAGGMSCKILPQTAGTESKKTTARRNVSGGAGEVQPPRCPFDARDLFDALPIEEQGRSRKEVEHE